MNYRGLRSLTARGLIAALERDGFSFSRQAGSHQRYRHPDGRRVTVAPHGKGDTFTVKTLKSMIELQAQWTEEDLKRPGFCPKLTNSLSPHLLSQSRAGQDAQLLPGWDANAFLQHIEIGPLNSGEQTPVNLNQRP
jgi:predicted RNA binding protein YcfA (HicA-like mRNA interferase family)